MGGVHNNLYGYSQVAVAEPHAHRQLQHKVEGLGQCDVVAQGGEDPQEGEERGSRQEQGILHQRRRFPRPRNSGAAPGRDTRRRLLSQGRLLLPQEGRNRQRPLLHWRVRRNQVRTKDRLFPRPPPPPHRRREVEDCQALTSNHHHCLPSIVLSIMRLMFEGSPNNKPPSRLQESKQQFEELLTCQICYCRAKQPTLCPFCSKVYCECCISTSLKFKSQCPNCRKGLKGQLTHCSRFINQLSSIIALVFQSSEQLQKCPQHGVSLNYYCQDCRKSACCECKMFGEHQTHRFQPMNIVYEARYSRIRELISELKGRIIKKEEILTQIENRLIWVKTKAENNIAEIEDYTEKYKNKMIHQNMDNDEEEYENVEELTKQFEELSQIKSTLLSQLEHAKKVNSYQYDQGIFTRLETLLLASKHRYQNSKNISVIEQAIPSFQRYKVVIDNYSKRQKQSQVFYSAAVFYEESEWRMVVYPRGSTNSHYVSIFLELLSNPDSTNLYVYQIELVHPRDQQLNIMKEHHSKFNPNQCWGYGKFMKSAELQSQHFVGQDDTLTLYFGIKFCNYYDLYRRRQTILARLTKQGEEKQDRIESLQSQLGKQSTNSIEIE